MSFSRYTISFLSLLLLLGGCMTAANKREQSPVSRQVAPEPSLLPVRVGIEGEVKRPGSYTFPAATKLSALISRAGGFKDFAHLRRIEIVRSDGEREECDFRKVKKQPDLDVILLDGDRVIINKIAPL